MLRSYRRLGVVVGFVLLVVGLSSGLWAQPGSARLFFHFINVGQADATLILNEGRTCRILIDAGDTRYPDSAKKFKEYLTQQLSPGSEIHFVIASHPHNDHIGSMKWVLETYRVRTYVDSGQEHSTKLYRELMAVVHRQVAQGSLEHHGYANVPSSKEAPCGPAGPKVRVLHPFSGLDPDVCEKNQNNCSVVAKVTYGSTRAIFAGDAEAEQEERLLADSAIKPQLEADILKVGHHGSDTSSSEEWLEAVNPGWIVISAGEKDIGTNKGYKHPRWSTVSTLLAFAGPRVGLRMIDTYDKDKGRWKRTRIWGQFYHTGEDGTVVLSTNGTRLRKE